MQAIFVISNFDHFRSMQTYLVQWLQLMLRWDAKTRGGGLAKDKRPTCFTMLDNILSMKVSNA